MGLTYQRCLCLTADQEQWRGETQGLGQNISAVERQVVLLLPACLLQSRRGLDLFYSCREAAGPGLTWEGSLERVCTLSAEFQAAAAGVLKCDLQQRYPP